VPLTGLVEHVEFQGHENLIHFNTGSQPAVVADLEAAKPGLRPPRRRRGEGGTTVLERLRGRAEALRAGPVAVLDDPPGRDATPASAPRLPGDLVVRTTPDLDIRHGMHVPLLVDIAHLFVFDQHGERICPSPSRIPDLEV
jgi:multiple sugar transport system ATP-binding protein